MAKFHLTIDLDGPAFDPATPGAWRRPVADCLLRTSIELGKPVNKGLVFDVFGAEGGEFWYEGDRPRAA